MLLSGAAVQLLIAGCFLGKLTEKASPSSSDVANGHPFCENWSTIVSTLLPFYDDIAGAALLLLFQELCAVPLLILLPTRACLTLAPHHNQTLLKIFSHTAQRAL